MRKSRLPSLMFATPPLDVVYVEPKVHAHLSAFSLPRLSYQALRSGSVTASSSSWEMMDAAPSAPTLPLGAFVPFVQADGHRAGFPMKAYLMSRPLMVPWVCQPQYWVQKPEVSFTSDDVRTK